MPSYVERAALNNMHMSASLAGRIRAAQHSIHLWLLPALRIAQHLSISAVNEVILVIASVMMRI